MLLRPFRKRQLTHHLAKRLYPETPGMNFDIHPLCRGNTAILLRGVRAKQQPPVLVGIEATGPLRQYIPTAPTALMGSVWPIAGLKIK
ncbi:MAG: hypothetical protein CMK45_09610 [Porticoccus sp.]|nr:hypothetical protein [Porticoccus sp.]